MEWASIWSWLAEQRYRITAEGAEDCVGVGSSGGASGDMGIFRIQAWLPHGHLPREHRSRPGAAGIPRGQVKESYLGTEHRSSLVLPLRLRALHLRIPCWENRTSLYVSYPSRDVIA